MLEYIIWHQHLFSSWLTLNRTKVEKVQQKTFSLYQLSMIPFSHSVSAVSFRARGKFIGSRHIALLHPSDLTYAKWTRLKLGFKAWEGKSSKGSLADTPKTYSIHVYSQPHNNIEIVFVTFASSRQRKVDFKMWSQRAGWLCNCSLWGANTGILPSLLSSELATYKKTTSWSAVTSAEPTAARQCRSFSCTVAHLVVWWALSSEVRIQSLGR